MGREYIPILVDNNYKKEVWWMDITNLSIIGLIELRDIILKGMPYDKCIQAIDSIIKREVTTIVSTHNIDNISYVRVYKNNKKEVMKKRKIKNMRRKYNDKHKR